jgi:hypothetical protein
LAKYARPSPSETLEDLSDTNGQHILSRFQRYLDFLMNILDSVKDISSVSYRECSSIELISLAGFSSSASNNAGHDNCLLGTMQYQVTMDDD